MIIVETFLTCDQCGENFGVDNRSRRGYEHRLMAKKEGWSVKGQKDYCQECNQKITDHGKDSRAND